MSPFPFPCKCSKCSSETVRFDYKYDTISNGRASDLKRDNFRYFGSTADRHIHELWKALFCPVRDIRK